MPCIFFICKQKISIYENECSQSTKIKKRNTNALVQYNHNLRDYLDSFSIIFSEHFPPRNWISPVIIYVVENRR